MYASGLEAFFLPAEPGTRFALFYPAQQVKPRGGVLYVHPFGEEMNKSRRMAALQARAFAAAGYWFCKLIYMVAATPPETSAMRAGISGIAIWR